MNAPTQRVQPNRHTLAALIGLLWSISIGALRDFVWKDLSEGMMSLRGLSRATRSLIWLGFGLLVAMVGALLFNDYFRAQSDLIPLPNSSIYAAGRGILLPVGLLPVTFFMITIAWSFALAGALHSHPAARLIILLLYLLIAIRQVEGMLANVSAGFTSAMDLLKLISALLGILLIILTFIIRWKTQPSPAAEFAVMLVCVSTTFAIAQIDYVTDLHVLATPLGLANLQLDIQDLSFMAIPLLLYLGIDIANFTRLAADWVAETLTRRMPRLAPAIAFLILAVWRLYFIVSEFIKRIQRSSLQYQTLEYAGAFGEIVCVILIGWGFSRIQKNKIAWNTDSKAIADEAGKYVMPLIIVVIFLDLINFFINTVAAAFPLAGFVYPILKASAILNKASPVWGLIVSGLAVIAAIWLIRRDRSTLALYLGIFGLIHLWWEITSPGRLLSNLHWRGSQPVDFWWTLLFTLVGIYLFIRRRFNQKNAGTCVFLILVTQLFHQTDFISSPFSPFFGFAGVGFIAFGIIWDALSSGAWANHDTHALPRISRIFLYLGYILLTVTIVNWALSAHDLTSLKQYTGDIAMAGFLRYGRPLIYTIFVITLAQFFKRDKEEKVLASIKTDEALFPKEQVNFEQ
jgi:hypothetical protein